MHRADDRRLAPKPSVSGIRPGLALQRARAELEARLTRMAGYSTPSTPLVGGLSTLSRADPSQGLAACPCGSGGSSGRTARRQASGRKTLLQATGLDRLRCLDAEHTLRSIAAT